METSFEANFDDVTLHEGPQPRSLGALAYAQGSEIHGAPGSLTSGGPSSQALLAHELSHVLQQREGRVPQGKQGKGPGINGDPALEQEADTMAERVTRGEKARHNAPAAGPSLGEMPIQREVIAHHGQLAKSGRMDFQGDLKAAMPVAGGEHRCHTVSYGLITDGVLAPINACITANADVALRALDGLVTTVYPNGPTAASHAGHPNAAALNTVAAKYHAEATAAITTIEATVAAIAAAGATTPADVAALVTAANALINALNNSPDNLRPGDGSTNSSIQQGLDLTPVPGPPGPLPPGATIVDVDGAPVAVVAMPAAVFRVIPLHEAQLHTLLTATYGSGGGMPHLFSSGHSLQTSDTAGMTSAGMTAAMPTPLAVELPPGSNQFLLFDV